MSSITAAKARDNFSDVLSSVAFSKERVVLTRRGKRLVAVVPMEDFDLIERLEDRMDLDAARAALSDAKKHGTVSWERIKKDLGL